MKKRIPKGKVGLYIYLNKEANKTLRKYCAKHKYTYSAGVEVAIENLKNKDNYVEIG